MMSSGFLLFSFYRIEFPSYFLMPSENGISLPFKLVKCDFSNEPSQVSALSSVLRKYGEMRQGAFRTMMDLLLQGEDVMRREDCGAGF